MRSFQYDDLPAVASIAQWAEILDVHPDSLRSACHRGELAYVTLGRLWRIGRHSIVEWLTSHDRQSA